tara:strand:- start:1249 stop:1389 length:141 start_codon:yes stop_codon:yes gene_type:complete
MKTTKIKYAERFENGMSIRQLEERYEMTVSSRNQVGDRNHDLLIEE